MECVIEANAMKKSFYQPGFVAEEFLGSNNGNTNCGFGDDTSFVDEFLNFSKEEEQDDEEFVEEKDCVSVSSQENSTEVSFKDAFDSLGSSELCVPTDDLADLEWVSHFVDDSFNEEFSFSCPKATTTTTNQEFKTQTPKESNSSYSSVPISGISSLKTFSILPKRSRTKRARTTNGRRIWSLGSPPSFSESSSTTTSSSSTSSSSPTSTLMFTRPQTLGFLYYPPEKKKQKPKSKSYENQNPQFQQQQQQYQRRCSHCGVQKTPQWRTGPMGAKTLCNACGVRFKSGRLLPEYRPACSPTFSSDVHSNNHRKVLEMRKRKEIITGSDSGMVPAVQSF